MRSSLTPTIGNDTNKVTLNEICKAFIKCFKNDKNSIVLKLIEEGDFCDEESISIILSKLDAFSISQHGEMTKYHIKDMITKVLTEVKLYRGEELVTSFENGILRTVVADMDKDRTIRYIAEEDYSTKTAQLYCEWGKRLKAPVQRKKLRTAICDYISKFPDTEETVKILKMFVQDAGRMFYDIIEVEQNKTNKIYLNLGPMTNHELECNFLQSVLMFEDEFIEAYEKGFIVKKPNGTDKIIVTVG